MLDTKHTYALVRRVTDYYEYIFALGTNETRCSLLYIYRPQRSWGKVIFSQASVILSTGGGSWSRGGAWSLGGAWRRPLRDGYCCRRYASYWNAFLLMKCLFSKTILRNSSRHWNKPVHQFDIQIAYKIHRKLEKGFLNSPIFLLNATNKED